jgi:pimeloyl-ACP methyl ester carboxylesterase
LLWHRTLGHGAEKVIAVHGWFGDHRTYSAMFDLLDEKRFSYAFVDIRGYGNSRNLEGACTVGEIASDVVRLADQLEWSEFHIIGHSMGGKAVQKVAIDAGSRIKSVVAVTPVPAIALPFDDATFAIFESACENDDVAAEIINQSTGNRLSARWVSNTLKRAREISRPEAFRSYMRSFIRDDLSVGSAAVAAPIMILAGEHDGGVPADMLRAVMTSLFPSAKIELIGNSGHYPMEETPVWLTTHIEEFMRQPTKHL